jgi:hypothetical protein
MLSLPIERRIAATVVVKNTFIELVKENEPASDVPVKSCPLDFFHSVRSDKASELGSMEVERTPSVCGEVAVEAHSFHSSAPWIAVPSQCVQPYPVVVKNTFLELVKEEDDLIRDVQSCIARFSCKRPEFFHSVRMDDNQGLGKTLTASVSDAPTSEEEKIEDWALSTDDPTKTTVLAKNLRDGLTRAMILSRLDACGFRGKYDFVYLPVAFESLQSFGYCFINFVTHEEALRFGKFYSGFRFFEDSENLGVAEWCGTLQGLAKNVERYRDSPLMHKSVPDELRPVLFVNGFRKPFPPPTKALKKPKRIPRQAATE